MKNMNAVGLILKLCYLEMTDLNGLNVVVVLSVIR